MDSQSDKPIQPSSHVRCVLEVSVFPLTHNRPVLHLLLRRPIVQAIFHHHAPAASSLPLFSPLSFPPPSLRPVLYLSSQCTFLFVRYERSGLSLSRKAALGVESIVSSESRAAALGRQGQRLLQELDISINDRSTELVWLIRRQNSLLLTLQLNLISVRSFSEAKGNYSKFWFPSTCSCLSGSVILAFFFFFHRPVLSAFTRRLHLSHPSTSPTR